LTHTSAVADPNHDPSEDPSEDRTPPRAPFAAAPAFTFSMIVEPTPRA
jgi:hypothetical protein